MSNTDRVSTENRLGNAMMKIAIAEPSVKAIIQDIAEKLRKKILSPLQASTATASNFSQLPKSHQSAIELIAVEHSLEGGGQTGSLLAEFPEFKSKKTVIDSMDNVRKLIAKIDTTLSQVGTVQTVEQLTFVMKCMMDMAFMYVEFMTELRSPEFQKTKDYIWTTPEELSTRVQRTELGQIDQKAFTFGIGTKEGVDVGKESMPSTEVKDALQTKGRKAGKSIFGKVEMQQRLQLIIENYDKAVKELDLVIADEKRPAAAEKVAACLKQLKLYGIPEKKEDRQDLAVYAKRYKTTFEKLAEVVTPPQPLIAGFSSTTARILITAQDIGALAKVDGTIDLDKAQILANCVMGMLIYAGHHSYLEVAECYNRFVDFAVLAHPEQFPALREQPTGREEHKESKKTKYMDQPGKPEQMLPYYAIGNYGSFLHPKYRDAVLASVPKYKFAQTAKFFRDLAREHNQAGPKKKVKDRTLVLTTTEKKIQQAEAKKAGKK